MKRSKIYCLSLCVSVLWIGLVQAQEPADPSMSTRIIPAQDVYYVGQHATLELTLDFVDKEPTESIGFRGLPNAELVQMGQLQQRNTSNPYELVCVVPIVFIHTGELTYAPEASGQVAIRKRSRGFVQSRLFPFSLDTPRQSVEIVDPPQTGRPENFSGIVGTYRLGASLEPTEAMVGDLLNFRWGLFGEGSASEFKAASYSPGEGFKVYPPRQVASSAGKVEYDQVVIPLGTNVTQAAKFDIVVFNPVTERYETLSVGPFELQVNPRVEIEIKSEAPTNLVARVGNEGTRTEEVQSQKTDEQQRQWNSRVRGVKDVMLTLVSDATARLAPNMRAYVLFEIPAGSTVEIREQAGDWICVRYAGASGWIRGEHACSE